MSINCSGFTISSSWLPTQNHIQLQIHRDHYIHSTSFAKYKSNNHYTIWWWNESYQNYIWITSQCQQPNWAEISRHLPLYDRRLANEVEELNLQTWQNDKVWRSVGPWALVWIVNTGIYMIGLRESAGWKRVPGYRVCLPVYPVPGEGPPRQAGECLLWQRLFRPERRYGLRSR